VKDNIVKKELIERRSPHLKDYDYSNTGVYYVTICVEGRKQILSDIINESKVLEGEIGSALFVGEPLAAPKDEESAVFVADEEVASFANRYGVRLTKVGEVVKEQLLNLENRFKNLKIKDYVIMPDHIHVLVYLRKDVGAASGSPTLHEVVRAFKSLAARDCRNIGVTGKLFQRSYIEHVVRDRKDYDIKRKYIHENPMKWYYREKNAVKNTEHLNNPIVKSTK